MSESFAGITLPEGDPGALRASSERMRNVGGGLHEAAADLRSMPATVGSWQGPASATYGGQCLSQAQALAKSGDNYVLAAGALSAFADKLRDARHRARVAIADAREAKKRIDNAKIQLAEAKRRLADAQRRVAAASFDMAVAGLDPVGFASAEGALTAAQGDATKAGDDVRVWSKHLEDAGDDLERARRHGTDAEGDAREAAVIAQGVFSAVQSAMPRLVMPGPPPARHHATPDKPFIDQAGDWLKGAADTVSRSSQPTFGYKPNSFEKGAWDSLKATAGALALLNRASSYNPNPIEGHLARQQLARGFKNAWDHPGEFAKQTINYDDLSHGRVDRWLGSLAPDALLAAATGGAGTAAVRSTLATRALRKSASEIPRAALTVPRVPPGLTLRHNGQIIARADHTGALQPWHPEGHGSQVGVPTQGMDRARDLSHRIIEHPVNQSPPITRKRDMPVEFARGLTGAFHQMGGN